MTPFMNAVACLLALGVAQFFWRRPIRLFKEAFVLVFALALFCVYAYFAGETSDPSMESFPFRMLSLALCFSTTALPNKRRRYLLMAQVMWLWIEIFGGISLFYRGVEMPWTRIIAISVSVFGSTFLSRISQGMEFALMAYWIAVWVFF